jgi:prepilin-type N-terminal cleavage/methylation domain-containing protein
MLYSKTKNQLEGFTIIELLIVLVIAGIILLLVLEAIPALNRSSENNNRKTDVYNMLQAVSRYELNNSGSFPPQCGGSSEAYCNAAATATTPAQVLYYTTHLIFYNPAITNEVEVIDNSECTGLPCNSNPKIANPNVGGIDDYVLIVNYETCDPNNQGQPTQDGAGYNNTVALYALDSGTSGGADLECQQL